MLQWWRRRTRQHARNRRAVQLARDAQALRDRSPTAARTPLGYWASSFPDVMNGPTRPMALVRLRGPEPQPFPRAVPLAPEPIAMFSAGVRRAAPETALVRPYVERPLPD